MNIFNRFWTWLTTKFRTANLFGKILIIFICLTLLSCLCTVPVAILSPSTSTDEAITESQNDNTISKTDSKIIETQLPTKIPPTKTLPPPTPTVNPFIFSSGTYLIGSDINPGIYKGIAGTGIFDSCYWARLKDLSGSLESIIANENSMGQFYIQVKDTDKALETHCTIEYLDPSSLIFSGAYLTTLEPGTYLVGIEISPGTYKGQAGDSIDSSCYWQRTSDVSGELMSIIANDNAVGQFYIQVGANDFALTTNCPITFTGD